jgi:hypothetical protein
LEAVKGVWQTILGLVCSAWIMCFALSLHVSKIEFQHFYVNIVWRRQTRSVASSSGFEQYYSITYVILHSITTVLHM